MKVYIRIEQDLRKGLNKQIKISAQKYTDNKLRMGETAFSNMMKIIERNLREEMVDIVLHPDLEQEPTKLTTVIEDEESSN